ncbi:MAG: PIG-L family deacetylase [Lachnospiraceae bacterium]|nr:PIG-L family deacetylase [Lachnospiraceae bacterium]
MNIVIVSPHPDDETLGAAGTIIKYKSLGHKVYWINFTDVIDYDDWDKEFKEKRKKQIEDICDYYEFDGFYNLGYKPAELDNISKKDMISKLSSIFQSIKPEWLILPDNNDAHSDHKVVFECCMACSKIFRYPYIKRIMTMEILSETDFGTNEHHFVANYFVDISDFIVNKIEALKIYDTEIAEPPFPRSIDRVKALSVVRGGIAGVKYAEAFRIIKFIE